MLPLYDLADFERLRSTNAGQIQEKLCPWQATQHWFDECRPFTVILYNPEGKNITRLACPRCFVHGYAENIVGVQRTCCLPQGAAGETLADASVTEGGRELLRCGREDKGR